MWANLYDWLLMLGRWLHITAAMMWIGTSFFFIWLDRTLVPQKDSKREGHIGELWMVHGGGFYQVEKMLLGPNQVPQVLHWFKWEAAFTWLSGFFLLIIIFYTGEGIFLLDPRVSSLTFQQGVLLGLSTIFGSWLLYDFLWQSSLAKKIPLLCHTLTIILGIGIAYLLCKTLSGRAAYIHMGGVLGTWMIGNVWVRILPNQTKMIAATQAGNPVDPNWGINAKNRSVHNNYLTLPVIFIMMSNHFPSTYGHEYNWVFLVVVGIVGGSIRLFFNKFEKIGSAAYSFLLPAILGLSILFYMTLPPSELNHSSSAENTAPIHTHSTDPEHKTPDSVGQEPLKEVDLESVGFIQGTVLFEGTAPEPKPLKKEAFPSSCQHHHPGQVLEDSILVQNGRLQNVLVRLRPNRLLSHYKFPTPKGSVKLDQKGCIFVPHVVAAQIHQKVIFQNSDNELHNINGFYNGKQIFNLALPFRDQKLRKEFTSAYLPIELQCDVHPWMRAYLCILENPFFAITDAKGEYRLENIPPGEYEVEIWHEVYGTQVQKITISPKESVTLSFTVKGQ